MKEKIKNILKRKRSLKNPVSFLIFTLAILFFTSSVFISAFPALNTIYGGYKATTSVNRDITAWSIPCKRVIRTGGTQDVFVPTASSEEWQRFRDFHPSYVSVNNCPGGSQVNGVCASTAYNCISGVSNPAAVADTSSYYYWRCDGQNGGSNSGTCSQARSGGGAINGQCAATHYNCIEGSATNTSDNTNDWTWNCQGSNGGTSASCSESKTASCLSQACSSNHYSCASGYTSGNNIDGSTAYTWTCAKSGCSTQSCSEDKAIDGVCGSGVGSCDVGTPGPLSGDLDLFIWTCSGINGGVDKECYSLRGSCYWKNYPIEYVCP